MQEGQYNYHLDKSYHNSIIETDQTVLNSRENAARKQEDEILKFFLQHPDKDYTPYEVWLQFQDKGWPKSSVQRAMTNLTQKREKLVITGIKRKGEFNIKTNCWKLK